MSSESENKSVQQNQNTNAVVVSQQQIKKPCNSWFSKWFGCNKIRDPLSTQITKQGVVALGDQSNCQQTEGQCSTCKWENLFDKQKRGQFKKMWKCRVEKWGKFDQQLSNNLTKYKQQNILTIGDLRVRSVLMAFSAAIFYKMISFNTSGFLRKSRNMGISFVIMGYWFVPQLFNPFLKKNAKANVVA